MRLRVELRTTADRLPWPEVLRPGRGLAYELLGRTAPVLARRLHEEGWGRYGMVPFGHGAPVFPATARRRGVYAVGGRGVVEFGSPLLAVVEGWAASLAGRDLIDWGGTAFHVERITPVDPPQFTAGRAWLRTETPVVMKGSGRDENGVRVTRQAWLLPRDAEFPAYFVQNLRRKAETLDLDPEISLESIGWIGAKRSFAVEDGFKVGASLEVEVQGTPETLRAIWSMGLGQANTAGFGWVAAA